jgi:hypothetical protein
MQSRTCSSYAEVKPTIDKVNWRANRMQSRTCSSYAEVKPTIDKVNYKFNCNYNMKQNTKDWIQHS